MKICFFSHGSQTNQDGASLSMINVISELTKRGHEVIVFLAYDRNVEILKSNPNVKVYFHPSYNMRVNIKSDGFKFKTKYCIKNIINNTYWVKKTLNIIKKDIPDIIHINGLNNGIGAIIANKLGIPYVWHIRQLMEDDLSQTLFNKKQVYTLVKHANAVIGISEAVKNKFEKIVKRDVIVVYNGVPLEDYIIPEHEIFNSDDIRLLLAGRIAEGKGHLEAIKAIQILLNRGIDTVKLIIVGHNQGHFADAIYNFVQDNGLCNFVEFHDHIEDLRSMRLSCDIGLLCSKKEAFGRVTIETQLAKMLFVGTNTGATPEIITDKINGLLYIQGDPENLAETIEWVINNTILAKRIAANGYDNAYNNYSIEHVVDQIENIYIRCI